MCIQSSCPSPGTYCFGTSMASALRWLASTVVSVVDNCVRARRTELRVSRATKLTPVKLHTPCVGQPVAHVCEGISMMHTDLPHTYHSVHCAVQLIPDGVCSRGPRNLPTHLWRWAYSLWPAGAEITKQNSLFINVPEIDIRPIHASSRQGYLYLICWESPRHVVIIRGLEKRFKPSYNLRVLRVMRQWYKHEP